MVHWPFFFSGDEIRRSADENYDFFGNRNFLYLTGIEEPGLVLLLGKDSAGAGMGKNCIFADRMHLQSAGQGREPKNPRLRKKRRQKHLVMQKILKKIFTGWLFPETMHSFTQTLTKKAQRILIPEPIGL